MDLERIGRRSQDVQAGLRDVTDSIVSSTLPVTTNIGMAALLAVHVRGLDIIENITGFYHFAQSLGIHPNVLPHILRLLEEARWIRVSPSVFNIKRIEESVPVFRKLYETLGEQWKAQGPSEVESATLALIEKLALTPMPAEQALSQLGLGTSALTTIVDIGELGGYLREYRSPREGQRILYTPLYMDDHPERILNFLAQHRTQYGDITAVFSQAKSSPGIPVSSLVSEHPIVAEMIDANVIVAPAIDSSAGRHSFLFPHVRTDKDPGIINKARVLLSCVRYGERFSTVTRVNDPGYLLERLRDTNMIGRVPHSNIGTQYQAAAVLGIGFLEQYGSRYRFRLYDTADNIAAVDLAMEMLSGTPEPEVYKLLKEGDIRAALAGEVMGGVVLPAANRATARAAQTTRKLDPRTQTARDLQADLLDDLRGVRRVTR